MKWKTIVSLRRRTNSGQGSRRGQFAGKHPFSLNPDFVNSRRPRRTSEIDSSTKTGHNSFWDDSVRPTAAIRHRVDAKSGGGGSMALSRTRVYYCRNVVRTWTISTRFTRFTDATTRYLTSDLHARYCFVFHYESVPRTSEMYTDNLFTYTTHGGSIIFKYNNIFSSEPWSSWST